MDFRRTLAVEELRHKTNKQSKTEGIPHLTEILSGANKRNCETSENEHNMVDNPKRQEADKGLLILTIP